MSFYYKKIRASDKFATITKHFLLEEIIREIDNKSGKFEFMKLRMFTFSYGVRLKVFAALASPAGKPICGIIIYF